MIINAYGGSGGYLPLLFLTAIIFLNSRYKIEDVYNGNVYIYKGTTKEERNLLFHLTFQININGGAVFKWSKLGVWPVYAVINELSSDAWFHLQFELV